MLVKFPHDRPRKHQDELIAKVERALVAGKQLLVSAPAGIGYRLVSACGMRTYSAWVPSILWPRIQPPVVQCEYMPRRQ